MKSTQEKIAVMQASVSGMSIQFRQRGAGASWGPVTTPAWNWDACDYRVAPAKPRVCGSITGLYVELTDEVRAALKKEGIEY